ncbi:MAG: T9SS type A sorting domain-containing protein [Sphingobacteriaceae bacterium]|nr:T9SS type A sorting domain-containing protein [Sphingobacteriaceae bacterium]
MNSFDIDSVGFIGLTLRTRTVIPLGTKITLTSSFVLANDTLPSNNLDTCVSVVVGSFDPNVKEVSEPMCMNINNDLVYRVRFQNTGTGPAKNILIVDTLDMNLNLMSYKLLYKSHPNLDIKWRSNNRMEYRFDNINLPDSNANEPLSHGEFVYSIKANASTPLNTKIRNRAWIYFDYNLPVITNVVENMLCSTVTGLTQYNGKSNDVRIFPNPASTNVHIKYDGFVRKIELYDIAGHLIQSNLINSEMAEYSIAIPNLSDGLYFIKLYGNNETFTNKLIIMQ